MLSKIQLKNELFINVIWNEQRREWVIRTLGMHIGSPDIVFYISVDDDFYVPIGIKWRTSLRNFMSIY